MKIDEAINVVGNEARVAAVNDRPLEVKALKLSIEALKWIKRDRDRLMPGTANLLPGETED